MAIREIIVDLAADPDPITGRVPAISISGDADYIQIYVGTKDKDEFTVFTADLIAALQILRDSSTIEKQRQGQLPANAGQVS